MFGAVHGNMEFNALIQMNQFSIDFCVIVESEPNILEAELLIPNEIANKQQGLFLENKTKSIFILFTLFRSPINNFFWKYKVGYDPDNLKKK